MDLYSLIICRKVSKSWQEAIDNKNDLMQAFGKEEKKNGGTIFHFACKNGHTEIAEMVLMKYADLNLNLNAKDNNGETALHLACENGHFQLVKMLVKKSAELNLNLRLEVNNGKTAFQLAKLLLGDIH